MFVRRKRWAHDGGPWASHGLHTALLALLVALLTTFAPAYVLRSPIKLSTIVSELWPTLPPNAAKAPSSMEALTRRLTWVRLFVELAYVSSSLIRNYIAHCHTALQPTDADRNRARLPSRMCAHWRMGRRDTARARLGPAMAGTPPRFLFISHTWLTTRTAGIPAPVGLRGAVRRRARRARRVPGQLRPALCSARAQASCRRRCRRIRA